MRLQSLKKFHQFLACALPRERTRHVVGKLLLQPESDFERCQISERLGCQHLALHNSKVNFDLVEPTGMDGGMDHSVV